MRVCMCVLWQPLSVAVSDGGFVVGLLPIRTLTSKYARFSSPAKTFWRSLFFSRQDVLALAFLLPPRRLGADPVPHVCVCVCVCVLWQAFSVSANVRF